MLMIRYSVPLSELKLQYLKNCGIIELNLTSTTPVKYPKSVSEIRHHKN